MPMTNSPKIETERLLLRAICLKDAADVFKYRSDKITNKYQGWVPEKIEDVNEFIENRVSFRINVPDTWFQFVIIDKESKNLLGDLGIHFLGADNEQAELGCTLDKQQQGRGYATEALRASIRYLFRDLNKHRIVTSIDPRNKASVSLVERLGFRKEAHFRKSIFIDEEWVDDLVYAMLNEDWQSD